MTAAKPAGRALGAIPLYPTLLYLLVYFAFWSSIDTYFHQEPPIDNFEQLNWAMQPALGYSKHPPFPTWILWLAEQVFPAGITLTYLLGSMEVLLMLALAHATGRETLGTRRAWLGTLMITCISYHTLRMHFYNHNTALLCANAAAMLCAWRAANTPRRRWWILLGACWAVGMLCKYQMAVPIACNLLYLLWSRGLTRRLIPGLLTASAVAALLLLPHLAWLIQNHFPTLDYASRSLAADLSPLQRLRGIDRFLASQLLRVVPVMVLAGGLYVWGKKASPPAPAEPSVNQEAKRFWAIHAFGPLVIMTLLAVFAGVDLQMHWGTAFLWALPLWYLSTQSGRVLTRLPPSRAILAIAAVQLLLMGGKMLFPHA